MKKILYVCKYSLVHPQSLKQKYDGQIKGFQKLGLDPYFLAFDQYHFYLMHGEEKTALKKIRHGDKEWYLHSFAFTDLYTAALRALKTINFNYLYVRNDPLEGIGLQMYRTAHKKGLQVICEIPTYPIVQNKSQSLLYRFLLGISAKFEKWSSKYIDLYAVIGAPVNRINGKPAINISNGVDVSNYRLRTPVQSDTFHLLGVASMSLWQGYDRAIRGLADYKGARPIELHIVGDEGDGSLAAWKTLAQNLALGDKVHFYPAKYGAELDSLCDLADLGLAPLALYRHRLAVVSALKVREYMSRGLPFVYCSQDSGIDKNLPYMLQVSDDDTALDMQSLLAFADSLQNHADIPSCMRAHAQESLSWEVQLKKLFDNTFV